MTMPFRARKKWTDIAAEFGEKELTKPLSIPHELHCLLLSTTDGTIRRALEPENNDYNEGIGWWYLPDRTKPERPRPLLVAHVDTLCKPFPPSTIHIDKERKVWSPDGILGADDRAGVAACLELRRKYGVAVLFCDGEEAGGWGARNASKQAAELILQHPYMIELDRHGLREVVYYRYEEPAFKRIFHKAGYWEFMGSFSDIAIISRELDLPGANVSIGFRAQHSKFEHLILGAYEDTVVRLSRLIEDNPAYTYIPKPLTETVEEDPLEKWRGESWYWRGDEFYPGLNSI